MAIAAYAASVGHSVWFSYDLGESLNRANTPLGGIYNESRCWCFCTHPARPGEVLSGSDEGIYRWHHEDQRWARVPSPMEDMHILQIAQAPHDPDLVFAGTRPTRIYRSRDNGASWTLCELNNAAECEVINVPRVTSIQFDPADENTIWVTIEIDGAYRSIDGGDTWERLVDGLLTHDTHNLVIMDEGGTRTVHCSTEKGLHRSDDNGRRFYPVDAPQAPFPYFRCMARRADDSGVMFLSVGDRPSGETGVLLRSRDHGETWKDAGLPGRVNSTIWWIGTNAADPDLIFCCAIMGQIFRSTDGGERWTKMTRELGELRTIGWAPIPDLKGLTKGERQCRMT